MLRSTCRGSSSLGSAKVCWTDVLLLHFFPRSFVTSFPASSKYLEGLSPSIFHQNWTKITLWETTCIPPSWNKDKKRLQHVLSWLGPYLLLIDLRDRTTISAEAWTVIIEQLFPHTHIPFFFLRGGNQMKIGHSSEIKFLLDHKKMKKNFWFCSLS